jgi:hypothetical protein
VANYLDQFAPPEADAPSDAPARQLSPEEFLGQFEPPAPVPVVPPPPTPVSAITDEGPGRNTAIALGGGALATPLAIRVGNAIAGNYDPAKEDVMATRAALAKAGLKTRVGDLTGLPEQAKSAGFSPLWRAVENFTENYVPFSGAAGTIADQADALKKLTTKDGDIGGKSIDAVRNAWATREAGVDALYKTLDQMKQTGAVVPDKTVQGLIAFGQQYGPDKLAAIPDKYTAARLLTLAGYPDKAAAVLSHLPPDEIAQRLTDAHAQTAGMSFSDYRELQKAIGKTIGDFSGDLGKPSPPEQAAFKRIYANSYQDLEPFAAQNADNSAFMDAFKKAQEAHKETRGFYEDNNFLRKVVNGGYDLNGVQFLKDFTNPANYQKVSPLAPYVSAADTLAFAAPHVADRAADELLRGMTREPASNMHFGRYVAPLLEAGAANALPGIYGGMPAVIAVNPALTAGLTAAQVAGSRFANSSSLAPRVWAAKSGLGTIKGALQQIFGVASKARVP